jgi:hypothetical protein
MRLLDYMYYCIYRYVLKTPDRVAADAWPIAFLTWTLWIHGLMAYALVALIIPGSLPSPSKLVWTAGGVFLAALFYWYYVWKGNGSRLIHSFEERRNETHYARMGAMMWWESLLIVFIVGGFLILSQKLTGWPPRP